MYDKFLKISKKFSEKLIDNLYPRICPVCKEITQKKRLICPDCIDKLDFVEEPVCLKCGKQLLDSSKEYCKDCTEHIKSYEYGMALLNYDDTADRIMIDIKYKNKREYIEPLAKLMAARYANEIIKISPDVLMPIPVHKKRLRERGYNQSALLAKKLALYLKMPYDDTVIKRSKNTKAQKELSPQQRLANLNRAFYCEKDCAYEKVLLVDDIYTTGSTIEACSRALKSSGASEVYYISVCIGKTYL